MEGAASINLHILGRDEGTQDTMVPSTAHYLQQAVLEVCNVKTWVVVSSNKRTLSQLLAAHQNESVPIPTLP